MSHSAHIVRAVCTGPTSLLVAWGDGSSSCVDLAGWIASGGQGRVALRNRYMFASVRVGEDGAGLDWGDLRIDAVFLSRIAAEQRAFRRADLIAWQAEMGLSNQEAAEFLGISLSAWNTYKAGTNPVPALVAMVCRAALRDPILRLARHKPRTRGRPRRDDAVRRG